MKDGSKHRIEHELEFYYYGQGGLLDILYHDGYVYVSYSKIAEMDELLHRLREVFLIKRKLILIIFLELNHQ